MEPHAARARGAMTSNQIVKVTYKAGVAFIALSVGVLP